MCLLTGYFTWDSKLCRLSNSCWECTKMLHLFQKHIGKCNLGSSAKLFLEACNLGQDILQGSCGWTENYSLSLLLVRFEPRLSVLKIFVLRVVFPIWIHPCTLDVNLIMSATCQIISSEHLIFRGVAKVTK